MEPKRVGRTLGIGVRVASNMLRERLERSATARPAPVTSGNSRSAPSPEPFSARVAQASSRVTAAKRGAKAFGQALWRPFTHAGSILWLEITGLFFALFTLFFVQSTYRVRSAWRQGPEHSHLLLYSAMAVVFGWFSFTSFVRAYRKSKRGPHART
jgi:hypothetical protein